MKDLLYPEEIKKRHWRYLLGKIMDIENLTLEDVLKGAGFIPDLAPCEFQCVVCDRIRPKDEFQSYDPLICIDCDEIDMLCRFKW